MSAHTFFALLGAFSLTSTMLLIFHMSQTWQSIVTWGQRLRYLTLLYFAILFTYGASELIHEHAQIHYRNIGAMFGMVLLTFTMLVSIHDDVLKKRL